MRRHLLVPAALALVGVGTVPAAEAGGGHCFQPASQARGTAVQVTDRACFSPVVLRVPTGATVRWENRSGLEHNLTGPGGIDLQGLPNDSSLTISFPRSGVFPYACTLHVGMSGAVVVGDGSYSTGQVGAVSGLTMLGPAGPTDTAAEAERASSGIAPVENEPATNEAASRQPADDPAGSLRDWLLGAAAVVLAAGAVLAGLRRRTPAPETRLTG